MKIITTCVVALGVCALPVAASAAAKVNGAYAFMSHEACEATITLQKNLSGAVTGVSLPKAGLHAVQVGTITFTSPNTTATQGNASFTGTLIEGGAVRVGNSGFNWKQGPDSTTIAYEIGTSTMMLGGNLYQGSFVTDNGSPHGVIKTFYVARRSTTNNNPNCFHALHGTKKTP